MPEWHLASFCSFRVGCFRLQGVASFCAGGAEGARWHSLAGFGAPRNDPDLGFKSRTPLTPALSRAECAGRLGAPLAALGEGVACCAGTVPPYMARWCASATDFGVESRFLA